MFRAMDWTRSLAVLLPAIMLHTVHAQDYYESQYQGGVQPAFASAPQEPGYLSPPSYGEYQGIPAQPVRMTEGQQVPPVPMSAQANVELPGPAPQSGYVYLGAPLYPSPQPNVPYWTGGTMITNQAFAPHEMLYPHTYKAIYPPFYHRVKGGWFWTPFGIRSHERWELQGTKVEVKYRSKHPLWPHFATPALNTHSHH